MAASLYLYPLEGQFEVARLAQRLEKHLWVFTKPLSRPPSVCGSFFGTRLERPASAADYNIQDPQRPEYRIPYFEIDCHYVLVCLNWSDTRRNDARRFLNFLLHQYSCKAQDHDGYWYHSNQDIQKVWMKMWLPK
jgi:hypothetical protein